MVICKGINLFSFETILPVDASVREMVVTANPDATEPEDHAAAVLDIMAGLIDGSFGEPLTLARQKEFYEAHVGCWMPLFFRDLEGASSSVLYAALAQIGTRFLDIESAAFEMD